MTSAAQRKLSGDRMHERYLVAYHGGADLRGDFNGIAARGTASQLSERQMSQSGAYRMIRRRVAAAGIRPSPTTTHSARRASPNRRATRRRAVDGEP